MSKTHRSLVTLRRIAAAAALLLTTAACDRPESSAAAAPDTAATTPDLSGIWQAANTANWELEAHGAEPGPVAALGALFAVPPGPGVVVDGTIPYLPAALEQRRKNRERRWLDDPERKCFMPGVPRAAYLPYPFQIVQGTDTVLMTYEFADAVRIVHLKDPGPAPDYSWMGWSVGRFEAIRSWST
jgi:hypothetical protein